MAEELKTRKCTKEQLLAYLEKHGSNMTEASNIAGTNPRTLNRYLATGVIPGEWHDKITEALKDRKPKGKHADGSCTVCGKAIDAADIRKFSLGERALNVIGITSLPTSGWHWHKDRITGDKTKVYPVCEQCYLKAVPAKREEILANKRVVTGKIVTKN